MRPLNPPTIFLLFTLGFRGLVLPTSVVLGQPTGPPFARWRATELTLANGVVQRTIKLPASDGNLLTTEYKPSAGAFRYFGPTSPDFRFEFNGKPYTGAGGWNLLSVQKITDALQGDGAAVTLQSRDGAVELTLRYLLYPNLPIVRKNLVVKNLTGVDVPLESVDVEKLTSNYDATTYSWVCADYGRRRSIGPYEGNGQDALVVVHNLDTQSGIAVGNEATGILKRTAAFWGEADITAGLTHKKGRFPFRKWLKPGESFATPQVFTAVYNTHKTPEEVVNTTVAEFVRKHLGTRLSVLHEKPTFVYNTWVPFRADINEKLVMELARAAADAGMKEFVIDDGWADTYGDWNVDKTKFPNGLKPVFDYIKSLGMKPGLWVSVGSAVPASKVYHQHPEWFVRDQGGQFANLHIDDPHQDVRSACFSTGWKDYIKGILLKLCLEHGLEYLKLDFAVVASAYRFDPLHTGCYATDHPLHRDHHESLYANYERMWELLDELHAAKPDLFIDCTFEAMGALQLIDYAMLKHAEGNWLSNFKGTAGPDTDLRVRQMAWWRSPAVPATALVIGNPQMQDKGWELHVKSLAGALPIMLGDPRKLGPADLKRYRAYADFLQAMERKHGIMGYRQDLPGFGEPAEGQWDGFQRINTDTRQGGLVGVFRHGSPETARRVTVGHLDPKRTYRVKTPDGTVLATLTGQALQTTGFPVTMSELYAGELFEITSN